MNREREAPRSGDRSERERGMADCDAAAAGTDRPEAMA